MHAAPRSTTKPTAGQPVRVMVVDDSALIRGIVARTLEADPEIRVTASVSDGQMAVNRLSRESVDVVVLDIEMPVLDGLGALPKLLEIDPGLRIVMASTLTERNADISIRALNLGAADYVPKPSSAVGLSGQEFQRELLEKVRALGLPRRARRLAREGAPAAAGVAPAAARPGPIALREKGVTKPKILAIGSSTGGPQALFTFLKGLRSPLGVPIVITQHMPATFTRLLAEHITKATGRACQEGADGVVLEADRVYLAPGDYHMTIEKSLTGKVLRLNQNPPENFCRPAVDPMLRSIAACFGDRTLVTILTGMGADGLEGGKAVVAQGGTVIAQDEESSVVWGMPGAVARAGICSAVLPLTDLAAFVRKTISEGRT